MQKLTNLLISKKRLSHLQHQLAIQEQLLIQVRESLPPPLDRHCIGAIPQGEELTLLVQSSAWASRIRYLSRELLKQLQRRQLRFKQVHIRVSIDTKPSERIKTSRRAKPLSTENAQLLRSLSETLDDDQLKPALQRLSRHTAG